MSVALASSIYAIDSLEGLDPLLMGSQDLSPIIGMSHLLSTSVISVSIHLGELS